MKEIFDQLLQFLQQGIAAIFRFVQLVWTWSIEQITKMTQAPWGDWPLWKQVLLVIVVVAVAYALFIAARPVWYAGVRVLAAFAGLLGALIVTLPMILIAGCIAVAGLWVINNFNPASLPELSVFERSNTGPSSDSGNRPARETTGAGEATGRRQ
jgi:hypothetical protein